MQEKFDISVLITVYNRKEFVRDAIDSILTNKINTIEIIIVTNIDLDINIDAESTAIKIIKTDLKSLSQKIAFGIKYCSSDIVSFLEDDDIYVNEKVAKIVSVFKKFPEIDFFHNNFNFFKNYQSPNSNIYVENALLKFPSKEIRNSTKLMKMFSIRFNSGYNLSSIAIRKRVIIDHLQILDLFSNYGLDTLVFLIYLAYGNTLFVNKNILTLIRIHENNASGKVDNFYVEKNVSDYNYRLLSEFEEVDGAPFKLVLILILSFNQIMLTIKLGKYKRSQLLLLFIRYSILSFRLKTLPPPSLMMSLFTSLISYNMYKKFLSLYRKM